MSLSTQCESSRWPHFIQQVRKPPLSHTTLFWRRGWPFVYTICAFTVNCACVIVFQVYDLRQVPSWSQLTSSTTLFIGAAAGPSHVIGTLAEVWIFIARQHTDARYWYSNSVCPSVRPSVRLSVYLSVRNVPVSDENGLTYCHSFFFTAREPNHSSFISIKIFTKFRRGYPLRGR